ncbi:hypothetical protein ACAG96_04515 [Candidatus Izemoplasma sp. B36]|uniref:hypothetical protein n=1 Tax=Candidatus Izemoplasma sp. B36 TaxID=3242468 RepID=UPI003556BCD0
MKKKVLLIFTLLVALIATISTTIQPTYAFEGTNAITTATTTAINDDSGNLMGFKVVDENLQGKHVNVILDLGVALTRDEIHLTNTDNANEYVIGTSNSYIISSLPHYNDDNTVEFSFYYASDSTGYDLMFFTESEGVKTSSLPVANTMLNIETWVFFDTTENTSNPVYPYFYAYIAPYEFLGADSYSSVDSFLLDRCHFYNYLREDQDFSDLVVKYESEGFAIEKNNIDDTNQKGIIKILLGFTEESLTEIEFIFDLNEEKMYPTLENVNDVAVLPGSWIELGSWDVDDTLDKTAKEMISSISVFSHETAGEEITDFTYRGLEEDLVTDWYKTEGTYKVVITQTGILDMYQWITEIVVTDSTPSTGDTTTQTPTIEGSSPVIEGETTLEFLTEDFSLLMLKAQYDLTDEEDIDALLSLEIKDEGTTLPSEDFVDGLYTVVLTCTDTDGNVTEKIVSVNLVNEIGENTIVVSATLLTALVNNWMSLVAAVVVMLVLILVVTKFKSGKKINRYKRRK